MTGYEEVQFAKFAELVTCMHCAHYSFGSPKHKVLQVHRNSSRPPRAIGRSVISRKLRGSDPSHAVLRGLGIT